MKPVVIVAIVVIVLLLSGSATYAMTRSKKQAAVTKRPRAVHTSRPTTTPPVTSAPTTTAPATTSTAVVYPDYASGIIPPLPTPSFILVPGANFPGLMGRPRDEASTYIITRYPRLVVRVVPMGNQITYDVRSDRVTLSYDPYTNRVINARIG